MRAPCTFPDEPEPARRPLSPPLGSVSYYGCPTGNHVYLPAWGAAPAGTCTYCGQRLVPVATTYSTSTFVPVTR